MAQSKTCLLKIVFMLIIMFMVAATQTKSVSAQPAPTPMLVVVNPLSPTNSNLFLFNANASLLNSTFTAAVYISTVTDLYAWQVALTWNNSIINYATAWLPTDNVFEPAADNGATVLFNDSGYDNSSGTLLLGSATFDTSNPLNVYPVNVTDGGVLCDVNFTIVALPNATSQTLSTNLEILLSNPNYPGGELESFIFIYPSTTETAVLAESGTVTIGSSLEQAAQTPTVSIVNPLSPTNSNLFLFNANASLLNNTFTAAVYISTVTDLYAWQVALTWNNSIINYATAWLPTDNVFEPAADNGATLLFNKNNNLGSMGNILAPGMSTLTLGCTTFDTSNPLNVYPVNVTGEGVLCYVNFTIAALPNATTQTLSTNLEILSSSPIPGALPRLDSMVFIYPSTTETAVLAESANVTIISSQQWLIAVTAIHINSDGSVSPSSAPISSVDNVTYTFTGNISYPTYSGIVVERNNTVIDGNGYTLQGPDLQGVSGIELSSTYNVTVENANIEYFWCGVWLDSSVGNIVSKNNVTNRAAGYNTYGVELDSSSNNTVYGNNMVNYSGVELDGSSNNNMVYGNNITNSGVWLDSSSNNLVYGNNLTNSGVGLDSSSNNTVCANNITGGSVEVIGCSNNLVCRNNITSQFFPTGGVELEGSSNNIISENTLTDNWVGVWLGDSSNNTVFGNSVTANAEIGIELEVSSNNTVVENTIANNYIGIDLEWAGSECQRAGALELTYSSGNLIYHNNFINNTYQAQGGLQNVWDNGYPSGGNYWSDYQTRYPNASEIDSSGIWNTPYIIDTNNTDHYPLIGAFSDFSITGGVDVQVVSNSTVSDFQFNGTAILFDVSGVNGSTGFCNMCLPTSLLNGTLSVFINGTQVQYSLLPGSNSTISYVYFAYGQSTEQVIILPEFPDYLILAMFMLATLSTIAVRKKKHSHS